jgi:hypothetical protein
MQNPDISPPDIEHWQNTRGDNARFQLPVPLWSDPKAGIPAFSHPVSVPYWRLDRAFVNG